LVPWPPLRSIKTPASAAVEFGAEPQTPKIKTRKRFYSATPQAPHKRIEVFKKAVRLYENKTIFHNFFHRRIIDRPMQ
jgi:hypothetical protein